jgi:hypothetical protein
VGLEWGPLSLVSTTEELLDRKVAAPIKKAENTAVGILCADHTAPSMQKLPLTSPISGSCSDSIVRSWTKATELIIVTTILKEPNASTSGVEDRGGTVCPKVLVTFHNELYHYPGDDRQRRKTVWTICSHVFLVTS